MGTKMTMLIVASVAMLAFPASAAASWKHVDTPTVNDVQLGVTGKVAFHGSLGGVECQITSRAKFEPGTTGKAETFDVHPQDETTDCDPSGGYDPCQVHQVTPQPTVNWVLHTAPFQTVDSVSGSQTTLGSQHQHAVVVTPGTIEGQLTGGLFCLVKRITLHPATIGLMEEEAGGQTVGNGTNVISLDINGTAVATIQTNNGSTHSEETLVTGTVTVEGQAAGTYSI